MIEIKEYVAIKKKEFSELLAKENGKIVLTIAQVNDDPASNAYVKNKIKDCGEIGIESRLIKLPVETSEEELLSLIKKLNNDDEVTGFIVQLPLPKHISEKKVKEAISYKKDVDGFHPMSRCVPATPKGILDFLEYNKYDLSGKNAVVIGRSEIVGKPLAQELIKRSANVTVTHSKTKPEDLKFYLEHADIVFVAIGKPQFIDNRFNFKKDVVIFDIGINRVDGHLVGDVNYQGGAYVSPVPGGVGLLTRLALLTNLMEVYKEYGI